MRNAPARLLLAAGLLLACACEGPTEPPVPFAVTLRALGTPTLVTTLIDFVEVRIECSVTVELTATGRGRADWTRVRARTFGNRERLLPIDSLVRTYAEWSLLSADSISTARPDTSVLRWSSNRPFSVDFTFWYRVRGQAAEDSVMQRMDCGPTLSPDAALPVVRVLDVRGSDPVIEAGDTVIVRYRAEGGGALWTSRMNLYGAFGAQRVIFEEMSLVREREERFVVPLDAALGRPIEVQIITTDIGSRVGTVRDTSEVVIVDVTPPVLDVVNVTPGQYHVGSAVAVSTGATDERALAHLIWEFGAPVSVRDSIPIGQAVNDLNLIVRPEWAGKDAMLRVWVRDHGNNYSAPWSSAAGAFRFHPFLPAPAFTSGQLASLNDVVYDARRGRLYAVSTDNAQVRAFDIASMTAIGTVSLPPWPGAADLTVTGDSLLITQSELRALSVVDLNSLTLVDTIALPPVDSIALVESVNPPLPSGVRVLANGKAIVKLHRKAVGGFNTVEVTLQSGASRLRTESVGGAGSVENWWERMGVTADRSRLLIFDPGCARSYTSLSDTFSSCAAPDPGDLRATHISSDATSSLMMIGGRLFAPDLTPIATFPYSVTHILPDGLHFLAATTETLRRIRISDGRIMSRMYLPFDPSRLVLLADGRTLLVFVSGAAFVAKFDVSVMP